MSTCICLLCISLLCICLHLPWEQYQSKSLREKSFIPDISIAPFQSHYYSEALQTTAPKLRRSQHAEAQQATTSEGLGQGPYMAARVGFEPATFRTEGTELPTEPPSPKFRVGFTYATVCNLPA